MKNDNTTTVDNTKEKLEMENKLNQIIKYKTFNSSEEFEKFQIDNASSGIKIVNIIPIPNNMETTSNVNNIEMVHDIMFNVFVTYMEKLNEEE